MSLLIFCVFRILFVTILQLLGRVLHRMIHRAIAVAWFTWNQDAATQRRLTCIASKGVRRMLARSLALSLSRWQEHTAELRRHRKVQDIKTLQWDGYSLF
jgi:hypothetical protein